MSTLAPEAVWAQRSSPSDPAKNIVFLTFNVSDVPQSSLTLNLTSTKLSYKATTEKGQVYAIDIDFYEEIDPSESRHVHSGRATECIIRKKEVKEEFWPRLIKEKVKLHWLKTDFDKWVDEDEQEEKAAEDPAMDPSMMSQFGGGDDAGGFGGIDFSKLGGGDMGGMGDMASMMGGMGDDAGGFGGIDFSKLGGGDMGGMGDMASMMGGMGGMGGMANMMGGMPGMPGMGGPGGMDELDDSDDEMPGLEGEDEDGKGDKMAVDDEDTSTPVVGGSADKGKSPAAGKITELD